MAGAAQRTASLLLGLIAVACVESQLVIRRNTQDCVYPLLPSIDQVKLWPSKAYLPIGTSIRATTGGFIVSVGCSTSAPAALATGGPGSSSPQVLLFTPDMSGPCVVYSRRSIVQQVSA